MSEESAVVESEEVVEDVEKVEGAETEGANGKETPAFMEVSAGEDPSPEMVPSSVIGKVRSKYRTKLEEKDNELEALRAKVAEFQKNKQPEKVELPKYEDFDTDEEYHAALGKYHQSVAEQNIIKRNEAQQLQERQQKEAQRISTAVDKHYERVDAMVKKHSIAPEVYRDAEDSVRASFASALAPRVGDDVAVKVADQSIDKLIAEAGEGSSEAMFYLGRNKAKLAELQAALLEDPSGIKAAIMFGNTIKGVAGQSKKTSQAPAPGPEVNGDSTKSDTAQKKKYNDLMNKGKHAEAFKLRRSAKAAGADVKQW